MCDGGPPPCNRCPSLQAQITRLNEQLTRERMKRMALEAQVSNTIWFIGDQLDPDSKNEKIRPARRLVTVIRTRLEMALELAREA